MIKDLVIDVDSREITIALMEEGRLIELSKEPNEGKAFSLGDVYLGRVKKLIPSLNAAFVDIGDKKDAFVHYLDLGFNFMAFDEFAKQMNPNRDFSAFFSGININTVLEKEGKIENVLKVGQPIIVQIVKEPISTKGSRLTSEISIAGRNIVLLPFTDKVSVSQKISSKEEKRRLERLMYSILPPNYGVILRTAAEGKNTQILDAELKLLIKKWEDSWQKIAQAKVPALLFTENNKTTTVLRDLLNDSFTNIHINDQNVYDELRNYIEIISPEQEKILKLYKGYSPILDHFDVSRQIKSAFGKIVPLKKGAYLVVEHTEALHVVDVNSGIRVKTGRNQEENAFEVNINAATEIARQLKLRDMGGIIIVDFIDMDSSENKTKLLRHMQELMQSDRAKHNVLPLTKFGLMQITRQRVRAAIEINTLETCPTCKGKGEVTSSVLIDETIERSLSFYVNDKNIKKFILNLNPLVEAYLTKGYFNSILKNWKKKYKVAIKTFAINDLGILDFEFLNEKGEKLK